MNKPAPCAFVLIKACRMLRHQSVGNVKKGVEDKWENVITLLYNIPHSCILNFTCRSKEYSGSRKDRGFGNRDDQKCRTALFFY